MVIETGNGGGDCGTPLQAGSRYLLFAYKGKDGKLWTGMCNGNQQLSDPDDHDTTVRQYLGLIKKGSASIFGRVFHTRPGWRGDDLGNEAEPKPYRDMVLHAEGLGFTTSTKTSSDGSYEFDGLPTGKYTVVPEVPKSLDFDHEYEENYEADLTSGQCANISFLLQPNTRIRGHLSLPSGFESKTIEVVAIPTHITKVNQFSGKWSFTDEKDRFDLWPLPPGDYYVGVNINSSPKADAPFPPTYYPGVTRQSDASVVHIDLAEIKELELPIVSVATPRSVHFTAVGLDGKPMRTIYIELEDLSHPGDAQSYVNVDLDRNGAGTLSIYEGYSYHLHGSHWVGSGKYWCAKPILIPAGAEPVKVQFVMERTDPICEIDKIDESKK